MFEVLVFVEGKTDEAVLRRLAETLEYNINKNSVGFIHMEGIRNFGNFAVNDVLEFLKTRGLDLYFVADRDEKDKDTVDLFKNKIGGHANLALTPGREIENIFVKPSIIVNYLKHFCGIEVDESEVKQKIDEACEELKEYTLRKYLESSVCVPLYPRPDGGGRNEKNALETIQAALQTAQEDLEERKKHLNGKLREVQEYIEKDWGQNKYEIVPGSEILNYVLKSYGRAFKKERDCARFATMVDGDSIPKEIRKILSTIGR